MRGRFCTQPFLVVEGGTCRPDAFLLPLRWVSRSPPHPPQCAHWGTFPPRGRLWTWECLFPSEKPPPPARPAGGRAVTGVGRMGRRPVLQKKKTPLWPPTRERWVQGGENLSPPWCSFLRLSSKESRAPPLESAGETTLQGPPCAGPEGPSNGPPPGAGRPTGRCAPR